MLSIIVGAVVPRDASESSEDGVALKRDAWDEHCDKGGRLLSMGDVAGGDDRGDPSFRM